jgi:hypothetical protein
MSTLQRRNISIPREINEHIDKNKAIPNFSQWVIDQYTTTFLTAETITKRLETATKLQNEILDELKLLKERQREEFSKLPPEAKVFITKEAPKLIITYSPFCVYNRFIYTHRVKISFEMFLFLVGNSNNL